MSLSWNNKALAQYDAALRYIADDSPLAATKIQQRIKSRLAALPRHPDKYPPDRFKRANNGSFRAFSQDSLRISYRVFKSSIHIIRVRHAKRKPLRY